MVVNDLIRNANPDIVIFLVTTLIAFFSWLIKSLIEKPISDSKETFNKFFEKRIEILSEIKTRLSFILYFPEGEENLEYKKQLQEVILRDGKLVYLNKDVLDKVIKISIEPQTNKDLVIECINSINEDLYAQISKIEDEVSFYKKFSNYKPFKRFLGITLLSLQYILSLTLVISTLSLIIYFIFEFNWGVKIIVFLISLISLYLINKWIKK